MIDIKFLEKMFLALYDDVNSEINGGDYSIQAEQELKLRMLQVGALIEIARCLDEMIRNGLPVETTR
jgi:hypothetical protein